MSLSEINNIIRDGYFLKQMSTEYKE